MNGPSPCGPNCTYAITFQGPSLACSNATSYQNLSLDAFQPDYTAQGGDYRAAGAIANDNFDFEVHFFPQVDLFHQFDPPWFLTCFLQKANYFVNVTYLSGNAGFDYQVSDAHPINATALLPGGYDTKYNPTQPGPPNANDTAAITNLNVWAIYQAMVTAMTGDVARYGNDLTNPTSYNTKCSTRH